MSSLSAPARWAELRISVSLDLRERKRNQGWERWAVTRLLNVPMEREQIARREVI